MSPLPSILVVGATGNTGASVVRTLSAHIHQSKTLASHQIIALTRSKTSKQAQEFARLPNVRVEEFYWPRITSQWLQERNVRRAFVASHDQPTQFADESGFYVAALEANVEYVVRISTGAAEVRPDETASYRRAHWAIETLLDAPPFAKLHWTSLQPNVFDAFVLESALSFVRAHSNGEKLEEKDPLRLFLAKDVPVGMVNPGDVGVLAARLLLLDDTATHNKARLVVNGPEDVTGAKIVALVSKTIGQDVTNVVYKDTSAIEQWANDAPDELQHHIRSIAYAPHGAWNGGSTASTTSKAVLALAPPKTTVVDAFNALLHK